MKLRSLFLGVLVLSIVFVSCKSDDDDGVTVVELLDRQDVYDDDIVNIESYLETHFYNYEAFNANPETSDFEIVFDTIAGDNADKIPLIDQVEYKMYTDDEGVEYKLYYLKVREGGGETLYESDVAYLQYEGLGLDTGYVFDSSVSPTSLNLLSVGTSISGVIDGFREGLIEFKTAADYTESSDGVTNYLDYGIGAIFIPSGLGYFNSALDSDYVPAYSPLIFKIDLIDSYHTDFDGDNIYSHLEDLDGDGDVYSDDTDGDGLANFIDSDDDGDSQLTTDEIETAQYVLTSSDPEPVLADNESEYNREVSTASNGETITTITTIILIDTDGDNTPDYLQSN